MKMLALVTFLATAAFVALALEAPATAVALVPLYIFVVGASPAVRWLFRELVTGRRHPPPHRHA